MSSRAFPRRLLSITGLLVLMLMMVTVGRGVAAQEGTPTGGDTRSCTAALGIGSEGDACISVVHASPDAPLVDIYVDGQPVLTGLAFGWWSDWLALPAGEHQIQVTATGTAPETAVIDATLTLEAGEAYQVAATGFLNEIAPQVYGANLSPLANDMARLRAVHTVPDAPAVDIAVAGGEVLISNLEFPNASDYLEVPAGTYDLEIRAAGTNDVILPLPGVQLEGSTVYDVYAIGTAASGAIAPFVIPTSIAAGEATTAETTASVNCTAVLGIGAEGDACVNVVHASPDAPAVDVWIDGQVALSGLEFGNFSGWVPLAAGEHQVQVTPAGQGPESAVIDTMVSVEAGEAYHVAATGTLAEIMPQVYPADLSSVADGNARVRVIHTAPDAPAVDVAVAGGDVLISNLQFPNASDYLEVPGGTYDLEVRPAGTMDVALSLPGVTFEAGMVYDVFAIGQVSDGTLGVLVVPSMAAHGA